MKLGILKFAAAAADIVGGEHMDKVDTVGLEVGNIVVIIIKIVLWITGVLAVAFIIYGGIKYVMSQGDSGKTTVARNTIMYAIIGLIVAIMAYTIVGFVIGEFGKKTVPDNPNPPQTQTS